MFALLPEFGEGLISVQGFHAAAFEVVIAAIQHRAHTGQFVQIACHRVLDQVAGLAPATWWRVLADVIPFLGES
jgi:hypothetical protein